MRKAEKAHQGFVHGVTISDDGLSVLTCGADGKVNRFPLLYESYDSSNFEVDELDNRDTLLKVSNVYRSSDEEPFHSIDHQRKSSYFATASSTVQVWDSERSAPVSTFEWGVDSVRCVRWNPTETNIICGTSVDRSVMLYDIRTKTSLRKMTMLAKSNVVAWNPMEPFNFTLGSEDSNCYTFDMRKLESALNVHKDFVSAVMDIDYASTGKEFVAGSYDCTLRLFPVGSGKSREIYYTSRMTKIFKVLFSKDSKWVLSGSDDTSVRLWKSEADRPVTILHNRQKKTRQYDKALIQKFQSVPELRKIKNHKHVPKKIFQAKKLGKIMSDASNRKRKRQKEHSRQRVLNEPERKKHIVQIDN